MQLKFLLLCLIFTYVVAEETVEVEEEETEPTGLASYGIPGDLAFSDTFMRAISIAGAVVTGVAGLAAILSFLLPMVGLRTCAFIGNCEDSTPYNQPISSNSIYDQQQGFTGYAAPGGFKKRSLEYVGPILKALTSAYEKYGPPAQQRKVTAKSLQAK